MSQVIDTTVHNRQLSEQFYTWRSAGQPLVLATVVATAGSTYSKAGRHLLIADGARYAGLVGGGCLEGDLLTQAESVFATGMPQLVTYDMRDAADDIWGMGLGCRGMMQLFLQLLDAANDWQPFSDIAAIMTGTLPAAIELVIAAGASPRHAGEHAVLRSGVFCATDPATLTEQPDGLQVLRWTVMPAPRLLVLGGGPDAAAVVNGARELGWHVMVCDHRETLLEAPALSRADERVCLAPAQLSARVDLNRFDAVVVMSHHLPSDQEYLRQLVTGSHAYVGVLGPAARRAELLKQLGLQASEFGARLRGPVGLAIGADSPASIALALLAEIHQTLKTHPNSVQVTA
ncbi:MAG: XdhC family protein [Gammaproteobacteria bacterium]|jgi:xanthine/CO dehydrogenase XdhC/CoxF family maturation factor|nr:XdhC family protein [Gammaproteobacteria bacterium]